MKKKILHIVLILGMTIFLSSGIVFAQQLNQIEEKPKQIEKTNVEVKQDIKLKDTINPSQNENQKKEQKAKFIDNDGDGINDNRCNGFGMQKGKGSGIGCGQGKGKRNGKK